MAMSHIKISLFFALDTGWFSLMHSLVVKPYIWDREMWHQETALCLEINVTRSYLW